MLVQLKLSTVKSKNLPQECKPQQYELEPSLTTSWKTVWEEFALVQSTRLGNANIHEWESLKLYCQLMLNYVYLIVCP